MLEDAKRRGFFGPGPVESHLDHATAFGAVITPPTGRAVDLGSGGGVPGLVLAMLWPESSWVLLDGSVTRTAWLQEAVERLGLGDRVDVLTERAEVSGHGPLRGACGLVVARGFASPAVTAECAAPLLAVGGTLAVAEPPGGRSDRWPAEGLAALGLHLDRAVTSPVAIQLLTQVVPCPGRYPRRTGVPAKRPLF